MMSERDWVVLLGRQWAMLVTHESLLDAHYQDGTDATAQDVRVRRLASDYGRSVRDAPPAALLFHAQELRKSSLR